jgi:hypothetical protein
MVKRPVCVLSRCADTDTDTDTYDTDTDTADTVAFDLSIQIFEHDIIAEKVTLIIVSICLQQIWSIV